MSVSRVTRLFEGRRQTLSDTQVELTVTFRVQCDMETVAGIQYFPRDERVIVAGAYAYAVATAGAGVVTFPRVGDTYKGPAKIDGTGVAVDDSLYCARHRVMPDQGDPRLFLIECDFTTDRHNIPIIADPVVSWGSVKVQRVARGAYTQSYRAAHAAAIHGLTTSTRPDIPVTNAAGEMFVPAPMINVTLPTIEVQMWRVGFDPAAPAFWQDRVNSRVIFGQAIGTVKIESIKGDYKPFYPTPLWDVHIMLHIDRDGWTVPYINAGYRERVINGAGQRVLSTIYDDRARPVTQPWPLGESGAAYPRPLPADITDTINWINYGFYPSDAGLVGAISSMSDLFIGVPGV